MIRKTIEMLLMILALGFNSSVFCNFIEDGWKGIKPLRTSKTTAEKILGTPEKITKLGYFNYRTADFFVRMNYSTAPCQESENNRGDYKVPKNTVLNFNVILSDGIKLTEFKFKREKYTKLNDQGRMDTVYYKNTEDAVMLTVLVVNETEYVARIQFDISPADKKKFDCENSEPAANSFIEDGWKGIKPFKTDKATVEKILDSAKKAIKDGYINYDTDEFFMQINYSNAPCKDNAVKPGKFNVPENTVLNYDLVFNTEAIVLSDFKFKREKYRRETDSKNSEFAYYINDDDGVKLYVRVFKGAEYVGRVEFFVSEKDKEKFGCKNSESAVVKPIAEESKSSKAAKSVSKIKFSSAYTKLNLKTCKPMVEPENDEDEVPYFCAGYKDYKIYVNTHGIANFYIGREISKDMDSLSLEGLPVFLFDAGFDQTIEWRLADGEPFACIVRAEYDKQIFQPYEPGMTNELIVRNLKGFAPISVSIDALKNKRANQEARRTADAGFDKL